MFLRPEKQDNTVRDFACVIRQGRTGLKRMGNGVTRLASGAAGVRAYRFHTRTGTAIAAANFSDAPLSVEVADQTVNIPAMDTVVLPE